MISGSIQIKENMVEVTLPVQIKEEGGRHVIYADCLNLCGHGKSIEEARRDFESALKIFFEDVIDRKTIDQALEKLGWTKMRDTAQWEAPIHHLPSEWATCMKVPLELAS
ncbi:MAG: hypothetical protein HY594_02750 [Candidatus Omnitrophica bacterium]|nr:hypothetical protein [Candidatus Omnitrophota bacterium]